MLTLIKEQAIFGEEGFKRDCSCQTGWQVFKTIRTVDHEATPLDFKNGAVSLMLQQVAFPELDLVVVSGHDLGFTSNVFQLEEVFRPAIERGLQICPAFIGPWLRQYYKDQPEFERLFIAMEPMITNDGPRIFVVQNFGQPTLGAEYARTDIGWYPQWLWVFVKPRK